jgi:uncharacterized protein YeeX (DUF496 family)
MSMDYDKPTRGKAASYTQLSELQRKILVYLLDKEEEQINSTKKTGRTPSLQLIEWRASDFLNTCNSKITRQTVSDSLSRLARRKLIYKHGAKTKAIVLTEVARFIAGLQKEFGKTQRQIRDEEWDRFKAEFDQDHITPANFAIYDNYERSKNILKEMMADFDKKVNIFEISNASTIKVYGRNLSEKLYIEYFTGELLEAIHNCNEASEKFFAIEDEGFFYGVTTDEKEKQFFEEYKVWRLRFDSHKLTIENVKVPRYELDDSDVPF